VPGIARFKVKIDVAPWNPTLRFEARPVKGGYYEGAVSHGRHPCLCFDSDDPKWNNHPWQNGAHKGQVTLDRIRRLQGDEAWLQAKGVPPKTIDKFRRAFERAFDACLSDAQSVPLADPPSTISCVDTVDRCPDGSDPSGDDGCPAPPARRAPPRAGPKATPPSQKGRPASTPASR
jgi:hypothetical protein